MGTPRPDIVSSSGSGKVDYLCMDEKGYTSAWIRDKDTGVDSLGDDAGQVKFGEGWDRANLQFADADGMVLPPCYQVRPDG